MNTQARNLEINHLREVLNALCDKFLETYPGKIDAVAFTRTAQIVLNPRMRTTLGKANQVRNILTLNSTVLAEHPDKLDSTFAHEVAHLLAYAAFGRLGKGHGRGWIVTMRVLGYPPERTHSLDLKHLERPHKVVAFAKCGCRPKIEIKPRRHKRISEGTTYRCRACKQRLEVI